jgi:hypothetical protein
VAHDPTHAGFRLVGRTKLFVPAIEASIAVARLQYVVAQTDHIAADRARCWTRERRRRLVRDVMRSAVADS